jgi:hypothetical protein
MHSKQEEMIEITTKSGKKRIIPRRKACFVPQVKEVFFPGVEKKKTVVIMHNANYIKDEGTGALLRFDKKKVGKAEKKALKRLKRNAKNNENP